VPQRGGRLLALPPLAGLRARRQPRLPLVRSPAFALPRLASSLRAAASSRSR
jgi:hypothetical protein